jgi:hypothetical protein
MTNKSAELRQLLLRPGKQVLSESFGWVALAGWRLHRAYNRSTRPASRNGSSLGPGQPVMLWSNFRRTRLVVSSAFCEAGARATNREIPTRRRPAPSRCQWREQNFSSGLCGSDDRRTGATSAYSPAFHSRILNPSFAATPNSSRLGSPASYLDLVYGLPGTYAMSALSRCCRKRFFRQVNQIFQHRPRMSRTPITLKATIILSLSHRRNVRLFLGVGI